MKPASYFGIWKENTLSVSVLIDLNLVCHLGNCPKIPLTGGRHVLASCDTTERGSSCRTDDGYPGSSTYLHFAVKTLIWIKKIISSDD